VRKVPLDAGFSCPNRDGTISRRGCAFCDGKGSGTGLAAAGLSLAAQWDLWTARLSRGGRVSRFMAYLQSFSNTHGPVEKLEGALGELADLPGLAGACVGTRPDCTESAKLRLLAEFRDLVARRVPGAEVWLELGLQSASDATLARIGRGHDSSCFADAARRAADFGLPVCAHLIAGLPGEGEDALLASVDFVNSLPVAGVKFHNLLICEGTPLSEEWRVGAMVLPTRSEYVAWVARALARLRPDIVVHRLAADPAPGTLLTPTWAADKQATLAELRLLMENEDIRQGDCYTP